MTVQRVLVTGFEPFGGETINPSWDVAQALQGQLRGGATITAVQLPCAFAASLPALRAAIRRHRPQLVLSLGLAGSRSAISLERVAVNLCDARIPDNAGARPAGTPVVAGGPAAHFSRLPVKALLQRLQAAGLPAELSLSAGSFVCNQVMYGLLHALRRQPDVAAGFIHLPPLPAQAAAHPGSRPLALAEQVRALELVVDALVQGVQELQVPGGRTD